MRCSWALDEKRKTLRARAKALRDIRMQSRGACTTARDGLGAQPVNVAVAGDLQAGLEERRHHAGAALPGWHRATRLLDHLGRQAPRTAVAPRGRCPAEAPVLSSASHASRNSAGHPSRTWGLAVAGDVAEQPCLAAAAKAKWLSCRRNPIIQAPHLRVMPQACTHRDCTDDGGFGSPAGSDLSSGNAEHLLATPCDE
jgi:hypothetical protein